MATRHHSWQFRLLVAERKFLLALGGQLLLIGLLLPLSLIALAHFLAAQRAGGPVDAPFDLGVYEVLCWGSIFVALGCALLFLRWVEQSRLSADGPRSRDDESDAEQRPRTLLGWVVPVGALLVSRPPARREPDSAPAPLSFSRLTWWWASWVVLHLVWLAVFLFAVGEMQAAIAGHERALAKAIVACRLAVVVQSAALIAAGCGFVISNVQMRRLFHIGRRESPPVAVAGPGEIHSPAAPPAIHRAPRKPPHSRPPHADAVVAAAARSEVAAEAHAAARSHEDLSDIGVYATVGREMAAGTIDDGLWTKAYALENGDERATRAHYIKLRVEQLEQLEHAPPAAASPRQGESGPHLVDIEA